MVSVDSDSLLMMLGVFSFTIGYNDFHCKYIAPVKRLSQNKPMH